jgi:hypothetical protein
MENFMTPIPGNEGMSGSYLYTHPYWSSPLILVDTISRDVSNLRWVSFVFSQELWSAEFSSREKWLVKNIFREPWWEPYLSFIFKSQLYIFVRFQIFFFYSYLNLFIFYIEITDFHPAFVPCKWIKEIAISFSEINLSN